MKTNKHEWTYLFLSGCSCSVILCFFLLSGFWSTKILREKKTVYVCLFFSFIHSFLSFSFIFSFSFSFYPSVFAGILAFETVVVIIILNNCCCGVCVFCVCCFCSFMFVVCSVGGATGFLSVLTYFSFAESQI